MEVCGGPRSDWEASRSLLGESNRAGFCKRDNVQVTPVRIGAGNSAHEATVAEQPQFCRQQGAASMEGPAAGCMCIAFPAQHFRMQQACGGCVEAARATGAKTLVSSRTSNNLAVRRCMDDFLDLAWHSSRQRRLN